MIAPTMSGPSSFAPLRSETVKRQSKRVYERALAARLKRIAGPPGALAATIALGLADARRRRISVTLEPSSIMI
jgi:hypothetical protein